ncbi:MAG: sensor domain-containing diguanylate cyclase [Rhodospirillales bacterium CG15_BIG_FIL_POST_REV_8_21_14_020_66_15]|nr:MAG: sensor domain-containing diguanylate cyclase [Rhodospirillales bacterium CG15_BIG_FIL_POST_REV_8_21_14_020_66_15]
MSPPNNSTGTTDPEQQDGKAWDRFEAVVTAAHDGIIVVDREGYIRLFNEAAEKIFDFSAAEIIGKPLSLLIPASFRHKHTDYVEQFHRETVTSRKMEERSTIYGCRKDGSEFPAEISISKISVAGSEEVCAVVRDISERAKLIDELRLRATTDPLTGLANRRHLMERGTEILNLAKRHGHPFSLLMIDIDHFKSINDTYGHDGGDNVLRHFASLLTELARATDVPGRFGGEEFIVLLPETGRPGASNLARRISKRIAGASVADGDPTPYTVSVGGASHANDRDFEAMLKRADTALYAAKRSGRNRLVYAPEKDEIE